MIIIKYKKWFCPKTIKVDKKSYKDILVYYIGYETSGGVKTSVYYF